MCKECGEELCNEGCREFHYKAFERIIVEDKEKEDKNEGLNLTSLLDGGLGLGNAVVGCGWRGWMTNVVHAGVSRSYRAETRISADSCIDAVRRQTGVERTVIGQCTNCL